MRRLLKLLAPSPFKTGLLVVIVSCLIFFSFGGRKPDLIAALDSRVVDTMFRIRGAEPTTNSVVIVDIDEKSLQRIGQWPWPRHIVGRLVERIGEAKPKAIGFDVVFPEADRTSPARVLDDIAPLLPEVPRDRIDALKRSDALDRDLMLGDAVARYPTVLGYVFQLRNDGLKNPFDRPFPSLNLHLSPPTVSYGELNLLPSYRAILNVPAIAQAESEGFFNVFPDASGTVRKVPLFMLMDGVPYPSLAFETLRVGLGIGEAVLHVSQKVEAVRKGVLGVSLGDRFIPTDDNCQMTINFRGPVGTFPYVSAADALEGKAEAALRGKFVLIGTSAAGLLDLRSTPFSNIFPGVEVQANIIDNILANDPITHDIISERGITLTLIVLGGLFLSALLAYSSPMAGGLGGILFLEATVIGNYHLFFLNNKIIGVTYPLFTVLTVFLVVTLFNYFFEGRERRFINKAFGHYVSPQVVAQLTRNPGHLTLAGEEKELTVLFSDIRGFTSISETMTSAQLGAFMNRYLTAMSRIIMAHKGTVDKFIGDAIMAIWGAPLDDPDHAANSVRAALEMMIRLKELRAQWQAEGLPPIDIGIGLNTGEMSVGNFGSDERFDYTVIGDNVNLASRLEGSNKLYGTNVIISEYTRAALGERFFCRFLDMVRVKGKLEPVRIYEPLVEGEPDPKLRAEVERFHEALAAYHERRFEEAGAIVDELAAAAPLPLYALYRERIASYLVTPPPADWDGAYTFTTK